MTLLRPVITEKSMMSASRGLFTFEVLLGASKSQVKQAVESLFKVKVVGMNILRPTSRPNLRVPSADW